MEKVEIQIVFALKKWQKLRKNHAHTADPILKG